MAYLRPLIGCSGGADRITVCNKPATHELHDRRNISYGNFCKACGKQALKRLERQEREEEERAAS